MRLIICESTGDWAAALRRGLPAGVSLVETRSHAEMWLRLADCPDSIVVLELAAGGGDQLLAALLRMGRECPQAIALVVADVALAIWRDAVREAGAAHFVGSRRRVDEIRDIVRHRLAQSPVAGGEAVGIGLEERILAGLPWGER